MGNLREIWERYQGNRASREDLQQLLGAMEDGDKNEGLSNILREEWESTAQGNGTKDLGNAALLERIRAELQLEKKGARSKGLNQLSRFWYAAAGIALLMAGGLWYFGAGPQGKEVEYITLAAQGSNAQKVLPDGSTVWLGPNTTLRYRMDFTEHRELILDGSAYFEVERDSVHPFSIASKGLTTTVLGTSFAIRSMDSLVEVVVATGLVRVASDAHAQELGPHEKISYRGQGLERSSSNGHLYSLGIRDRVHLDSIPLGELAQLLAEKYGKKFRFMDSLAQKKVLYSLTLYAGEPWKDFMARINYLNEVQLKQNDHMIEISTVE